MEKNTLLYYKTALSLGLPLMPFEDIAGFIVKLGRRRYFFRGSATPFNCSSSINVIGNKYCANKVLESFGFPVPKADAFNFQEYSAAPLESLIKNLSFPLVVKPMQNSALGRDVLCNIGDIELLREYMDKCFRTHEYLSIEEFHGGLSSYRVLVFCNRVIGVVQRFSARVTGDGVRTVQALIDAKNKEREKLMKFVTLGPIRVDEECLICLQEQKVTLDMIPKENEVILLCYTCNSSRGGTMESQGKQICKENAKLLCDAARALGLELVGFDVACVDINIPIRESRGVIIEANNSADISIHECPTDGKPHWVSKKILKRLIYRHPIAYCLSQYKNARIRTAVQLLFFIGLMLISKFYINADI